MPIASALQTPATPPRPPEGRVVRLRAGGGRDGPGRSAAELWKLGVWAALAPIGMLFLSFASAYVVRRGLGQEWLLVALPALIWWNTAILLASSGTLEIGRGALRRRRPDAGWIWGTFGLGLLFLVGQVAAWVQLTRAGVAVGTTAYGSFFYVLTAAHALHLLGGIGALAAGSVWPRDRGWHRVPRADALQVIAVYWHFMSVLWVSILLLLVLGR